MMQKYFQVVRFICLLILLSGCSMFESNSSLMSPPSLPGEKEEIRTTLVKYISSDAELLTPWNVEQNNPILLDDLDGDGIDEAVVFYKGRKQTSYVKGIVLKDNNGWEKVANFKSDGKVLVDVQFADINHDGKKDIFVGTAYSEDAEGRVLYIYDIFSEVSPVVLFEESYSYFITGQFNPEFTDSLILIKFNNGNNNTVFLYEYHENELKIVDQLEVDPFINGYYHLESGRISPTTNGIMLDVGIGAHSARTFIISVENNKLKNLFPKEDKDPTIKMSAVKSGDMNKDGILEFGILEEPYLDEELPYSDTPYLTVYYQLDEDYTLKKMSRVFYDYHYKYKVEIPLELGDIKIRESDDRKYLEIIDVNSDEVIYDVYVSDKKKLLDNDWFVLDETEAYVYLSKTANDVNKHYFKLIQFTQ